jgi:hypothetical protein
MRNFKDNSTIYNHTSFFYKNMVYGSKTWASSKQMMRILSSYNRRYGRYITRLNEEWHQPNSKEVLETSRSFAA